MRSSIIRSRRCVVDTPIATASEPAVSASTKYNLVRILILLKKFTAAPRDAINFGTKCHGYLKTALSILLRGKAELSGNGSSTPSPAHFDRDAHHGFTDTVDDFGLKQRSR